MRRLILRTWRFGVFLLAGATGLIAQDGNWTYRPTTDVLMDVRNDELWTEAVLPASPSYRLGVTCDDTEYIAVVVRSDAEIASAASVSVRFDGGSGEVLPVAHSLANSNSFDFEPAGAAVRRILASKSMAVSLRNKDLQQVSVQFDVTGLSAVLKQMPLKCQQRFTELVAGEKPAPKTGGRPRKTS
jgi:hypothetical protein